MFATKVIITFYVINFQQDVSIHFWWSSLFDWAAAAANIMLNRMAEIKPFSLEGKGLEPRKIIDKERSVHKAKIVRGQ